MSNVLTASVKRTSLLVLTLLTCISTHVLEVHAQVGNACSCPIPDRQTQRILICWDSEPCYVDVTFCNQIFAPASTTVTCGAVGKAIDMYTTIYSICEVEGECELDCEIQDLIDAVLCQFNPIGVDYFGVKSGIPDCDTYPYLYCWVVATPRCMQKIGSPECWLGCPSGCCVNRYEFCKDPITGNLRLAGTADCTIGGANCNTECGCDIVCHEWNPEACPTCDP